MTEQHDRYPATPRNPVKAALRPEPPERFWKMRLMQPRDENFVVYSWCQSYARSREGQARDLNREGAAKSAWWNQHTSFVETLIRQPNVQVEVAVDHDNDGTLWGYAVTSGDVVHYALCKRGLSKGDKDMAQLLMRDLLGDRLDKPCGFTSELRDLYLLGMVPRDWYPSATWMALNYQRSAA